MIGILDSIYHTIACAWDALVAAMWWHDGLPFKLSLVLAFVYVVAVLVMKGGGQ